MRKARILKRVCIGGSRDASYRNWQVHGAELEILFLLPAGKINVPHPPLIKKKHLRGQFHSLKSAGQIDCAQTFPERLHDFVDSWICRRRRRVMMLLWILLPVTHEGAISNRPHPQWCLKIVCIDR